MVISFFVIWICFEFRASDGGLRIYYFLYWDETKEKPSSFFPRQFLWDGTQISMQADKTSYNYQNTANITVDIIGAGTYHLRFNCQEAGISEEKDIQVPEEIYHLTQQFQVPIGLNSSYIANISAIDSSSRETQKQFTLVRTPIAFDYQGNFGTVEARAGSTLDFNAQIKILSGTNLPLNGQLMVSSSQNYFENETIAGKAELNISNSLENATLKAQIIRYIQSQGIEEETPGSITADVRVIRNMSYFWPIPE